MSNARNLGNITAGGATGATTTSVTTAVNNIIDSAPGALDTLNELAAALGDDANYATTTASALAAKLPLSGGALTGPVTTNSTFDGVDIATRDAVLTSTTTTANAALPKAGGAMTGVIAGFESTGIDDNASSTSITLLGSGKVGIGTAPSTRGQLHVHNATDNALAAIQLTSNETGAGVSNGFAIQVTPNAANGDKDCSLTQFENANMLFHTNNTERMRLDSAGRLSLGPDASDILIDPASTNSNNNLIYMRGNASGDKSSIQMNHYGSADYHIGVGHVGTGKFNIANELTGNDFVIDTSGNVGIGTTTPSAHAKLHVAGAPYAFLALQATNSGGRQYEIFSNAADESFHLYDRTADLYRLTVDETGNVGIGTTSPSDKLTVTGGHINLPTVNSYIKGSGHNIVQVDNTRTYFYGGTDGLQFRTADNSAPLWHITNGGLLKREGGSAVDSSNTNFNINLPANGGITMGSAYTFSNIYGDAGGNLFLKANAYPANTGSATSITLQTGNASGGTDSAITVSGGNISFPNGKGINFGASTGGIRGTSSNNVLDDYEEGTYTPTYSNGSVSYSIQVGNYVKIGTFCRVWFDVTITGASGQSGTPTISLPFNSSSTPYDMGAFTPWAISDNYTSGRTPTQWIATGTSYMMMYTWTGDSAVGHAVWGMNTTGRISGSVSYTTA